MYLIDWKLAPHCLKTLSNNVYLTCNFTLYKRPVSTTYFCYERNPMRPFVFMKKAVTLLIYERFQIVGESCTLISGFCDLNRKTV